ncbi:stage V sporulation protein D [Pueribacillus sp. YX66]|uniref:stage V sporulation protein D n=1 Tax=Pueribacillus sp. YX66 TaxID=3229242 RepID=UPI00358D966A
MRVSNVTVRRRLIFAFLIGIVIFLILVIRLGYVQIVQGEWLTEKAKDSWSRNIPFEAERGEILDRNDIALAKNVSAPSVLVVPRQVKDAHAASEQLASILDMPQDKVYKILTRQASSAWIHPEGRKISNEKANEIRKLRIPGVYIAEDNKRHYPFGSYLSHVLGFAGIDNQGLTGLEKSYDEELSGKKGRVEFYADAKGNRMPFLSDDYTPSQSGLHLKLTIDSRIQTIIERELDNAETIYRPDGALAIAMDPNTGQILGMSSRPDFNPENFREVPPEVYNQNKPVWSTYEPGSTFKIITLAAALEENKIDLHDDHFHDPGYVKVANARLRCWKSGGHGSQTFLEVVENSCNPGFVNMGQKLGKETLFSYIRNFGFGEKTGIDLQGEGTGILFNLDHVGPVELATSSFGQGVSVTPIQQITAVSAAINGGYVYEPYIAKEWIDPETNRVIERKTPKKKRQVISEETSKKIRESLESVVAKGTGKNAFIDGFRVGGKTGTAQKAVGGKYLTNNYIVSFIGFAPADDPQIIVYVAVDNPKGTVQFGGTVAAPIAGNIIKDSLSVMEVKPRKKQIEKERTWTDTPLVEVPKLVGQTVEEIHNAFYNLDIDSSGSGHKVIQQSPSPGTKVKEGSTIRIYLGDK